MIKKSLTDTQINISEDLADDNELELGLDDIIKTEQERQEQALWQEYQNVIAGDLNLDLVLEDLEKYTPSSIYLAPKEVSDWLERKIVNPEADININNIRYGAGKTFAICKYFSELRNVGIFTDQHRHIDEEIKRMLIQNFRVDENIINHEKGFEKDCVPLTTTDEAIREQEKERIEKINKLLEAGVPPNIISRVVCPDCQFRRNCRYKFQFNENKIRASINIAPYEFLGLKHNKNLDAIACDEPIDKWLTINYALEENKIENLTNFSVYEASINRINELDSITIDKDSFKLSLNQLKNILLRFNEKIKSKSILNKFNFEDVLTNPEKRFVVEEVNEEDEHYFLVMHPDKILDLNDMNDVNLFDEFYSLFYEFGAIVRHDVGYLGEGYGEPTKFQKTLKLILIEAAKNVNLILIRNVLQILRLLEVFIFSFLEPIQVNEKIAKVNGEYKAEIGRLYKDNWKKQKKSWFVFDKPQIWDLFELAKYKKIVWGVASFDEAKFKILLEDFNKLQIIKSTLLRYDYRPPLTYKVHGDIEKELKKKFQPYKTKVFNVKRIGNGSFSRTALKEYQKELIEYLRFLITKDLVGWNISTKTIMVGYHNFCHEDEEGWNGLWVKDLEEICEKYKIKIEDFWKYWGGMGLLGSNFGKDKNGLILIGDPRPPQEEYILEHIRLFKELPNGLIFETKKTRYDSPTPSPKKSRISDDVVKREKHSQTGFNDKKLDYIFKLLVADKKNDAIHRLRNLYDPEKEIFILGLVTDYVKKNFEVKEVFLPKMIVKPILEDTELIDKIEAKVENEGLSISDELIPKVVFHTVMDKLTERFNWTYDRQNRIYRKKSGLTDKEIDVMILRLLSNRKLTSMGIKENLSVQYSRVDDRLKILQAKGLVIKQEEPTRTKPKILFGLNNLNHFENQI